MLQSLGWSLPNANSLVRLLLTGDISHHVVCCERLLDGNDEDKALYEKIVSRVCVPVHYNIYGLR